MEQTIGKLTTGEPLSIDQLIEYLPALKEVARAQVENWAKGAAVLHRYKKREVVCQEGEFRSTAYFLVSRTVDFFIRNPLTHPPTAPALGPFGPCFLRVET